MSERVLTMDDLGKVLDELRAQLSNASWRGEDLRHNHDASMAVRAVVTALEVVHEGGEDE